MATVPISLAHLSALALHPLVLVDVAAQAGFDAVDLRLAPATATDRSYGDSERLALARQLRSRLADNGLVAWSVEIIRIREPFAPADFASLMEAAALIGARRLKVVSDESDPQRTADHLAGLAGMAAQHGLMVDLEFMVFTGVRSLGDALAVVQSSGSANVQVLIDALHWMRSAGTLEQVRAAPAHCLGYLEWCDGPLLGPTDLQGLLHEARADRLPPGEGSFPLQDLLRAVPHAATISLEVPQREGAEPLTRCRHLARAARAVLAAT